MKYRNYTYKILPELNLLLEFWSGEVTLENYIEYKKQVFKSEKFNPHIDTIADFRNSFLNVTENDILKLIEFHRQNGFITDRISIHITQTPNHVLYSYLYAQNIHSSSVHVRTVTVFDSAIMILHLEKHKAIISESFEELRQECLATKSV